MENIQFAILAVDKKAIEEDAKNGVLGDFVVGRLITPYISLLNKEYLRDIELITKQRFIKEDLEDLIIEFGELARGLVIEPQYLVLERMRKRSKAYPPLKYSYIHMLSSRFYEKNMHSILDGYHTVLYDLAKDKLIKFDGEYIALNNSFIDNILSTKTLKRVLNRTKYFKKALYSYITHGRAGKVTLDIVLKELTSKVKRELKITFEKQDIEDPKNYLFLDTKEKLIKLSEKNTIKEIIYKIKDPKEIKVQSIAGAMNDVYLVKADNEKLIVKRFTDWFNIKWFALSIIAYGTKVFTLSGKARLSNEYGINHLLAENNIPVPEIVSINIKERVLIEKYIEGKSILDIVKEAVKTENLSKEQKKWAFQVGKLIAKIHSLDIALGD
ncbi:MAG: hypothetical protein JSV20_01695 [Candidatus Bathyarchaeota archaeon]|nr:MAG: hypothetical protein JSV20_01695 [Candidatus Bathyarchaeota archaeon]